jgi:hypothetical protein
MIVRGAFSYTFDPDLGDSPKFRDLFAYWERKRGTRAMPTRADIDPIELKTHLGHLVLVEVLPGPQRFRFRLAGTKVVEAYGRDSTGKTVDEVFAGTDPVAYRFLLEIFGTVVERRAILRVRGPVRPPRQMLRNTDALLLPLDAGDGTVGMILIEQSFS